MTEQPAPHDRPPSAPAGQDGATRTAFPSLVARTASQQSDGLAGHVRPEAPSGYELLGELGRGGMGVVYRARQRGLNREVALKVVLAGGHAGPAQRQRFLREAEAAAAISHPNVVQVFEVGERDGLPFMALELCPGGTLADRLGGTPLPPDEAARLVETLARAVAAAHERGVVHRDLKPANVLLTAGGIPKVGDFGLAKLAESGSDITAAGAVFGTPCYMPPEQARGDSAVVGPAADVYALGAVLYECLTGRPPFKGATPADTVRQVLHQEPVGVRALNPAVPTDLETVCHKCLRKEPGGRYATAAALADDLGRFLGGRPVVARPVGPAGRAWRWARRNPVVAAAAAAVAGSLLAGAAVSYAQYRAADRAREQAVGEAAARAEALARLSEETAAKDAALRNLTAEQAATEDALLDGLLRPLRSTTMNETESLRPEERDALTALAAVPSERLRFRFVERGLGSPAGAAKLAAMRAEVVWAVVGLDRAAGVRLRDAVHGPLATSPDAGVLLACALLAEALPSGEPAVNGRAARVVLDRLAGEKDVRARRDLAAALHTLVPRLGPAGALALSHAVMDRVDVETDHVHMTEYAGILSVLGPRLSPVAAGQLARYLDGRLAAERHSYARHFLAEALAATAGRLTQTEAGHLSRSLAEQARAEPDSYALGGLARAVAALAGRIDRAEAAGLCGPLARSLAGRAAAGRGQGDASFLADGITALARHLTPAEAAAACGPPARVLMNQIVESRVSTESGSRPARLAALAGHMDPVEAGQFARALADRMGGERAADRLANMALALAPLAGRLGRVEAKELCGPLARLLTDRLGAEPDGRPRASLAAAARALAEVLGPGDADPLLRTLAARVPALADLPAWSAAVAALAERVDPALAAEVCGPPAKALSTRAAPDATPSDRYQVAVAVGRLARHLDRGEAAAMCGPLAQGLVQRALAASERGDMAYLTVGVAHLVAGLDDAQVVGTLRANGLFRDIQRASVAQFGLSCGPDPVLALPAGPASVAGLRTPRFATVWDLVDWAEQNRPDLDVKSRSTAAAPAGR